MKKLLLSVAVLISAIVSAQNPGNYIYRPVRERTIAGMWDSTATVPAGVFPTQRGGGSGRAGSLFTDTVGGGQGLHYLRGGTYRRLTDSTELADTAAAIRAAIGVGGGGSPNTSVGSGYKVAINATNNVKSLTAASPLAIDSATTNQVNFTIANAAADGSTKGAASFTANDFNATSGNISIDYTNGQAASGSNKGFLTSTDWTTFNGKLTSPLTTLGDIMFYNTAAARLAGNTENTKKVLTQQGNGTISAAPVWDSAATIYSPDRADGKVLAWDQTNFRYHHVTAGSGGTANQPYKIMFRPAQTANAPPAGDSILICDSLTDKGLQFYRDGELQYENDSTYGYRVSNDTLFVHPPFYAGERDQLYIWDNPIDTAQLCEPPAPPAEWEDLTFTTNTGTLIQTVSDWTTTGTNGWNNYGLDSKTLTADGAVRSKFISSDGWNFGLGFNASNSSQTYTGWEYGFIVSSTSGEVYRIVNGTSTTTSYFMTTTHFIKLDRAGSTFTIQTSADGTTWTVRYTFAATSSATHYVNMAIYQDGKCYDPEGINLFYVLPLFFIGFRRKKIAA